MSVFSERYGDTDLVNQKVAEHLSDMVVLLPNEVLLQHPSLKRKLGRIQSGHIFVLHKDWQQLGD